MNKLMTLRVLLALAICALVVPLALADSYVPASGAALRTLHPSRITPAEDNRAGGHFSPAMYGVKISRKEKSFANLMAFRAEKAMTKHAKREYRFKVTPPAQRPSIGGLPSPKPAVATAAGNASAETITPDNP